MFKNREDAGRQLVQELRQYAQQDAVVVALPRGGIVLGSIVAQALKLPLEAVALKKIGHPHDPEFAIGAVDEDGMLLVEHAEASEVPQGWLGEEIERQKSEAKRRGALYRQGEPPFPLSHKTAIIVDDGVATGLSMRLAVGSVQMRKPRRVVVAVPVAPSSALEKLREDGVEEIVVIEPPERFKGSVGAHYARFDQLDDEELIRYMQDARRALAQDRQA